MHISPLMLVIFWSLLGALVNILLSAIAAVRKKETVSGFSIVIEVLQLISAPLIAVAFFALLYSETADETQNQEFIVLSFVTGLFSGYLFLPLKRSAIAELVTTPVFSEPAAYPEPVTAQHWEEEQPYGLLSLATVTIMLELDDAGLFFDEKREIEKTGFEYASVSLQSVTGGEIITAVKVITGNSIRYAADDVEQGTYLVRAMQSMRMQDHSLLNLFGEVQLTVNDADVVLTIQLRKLHN